MKISNIQLFWIIFTFLSGNMFLLTISPAIAIAKQDAWISFIIAAGFGGLIIFIGARAALLFPHHTFLDFSKLIFGKWFGTFIVLLFLFQLYTVMANILSEFSVFATKILLPNTPTWVIMLTMIFLIIYGTFIGGIEGIGRSSEVFGPIILIAFLVVLPLSIPNIEINRLLPVVTDTAIMSLLKGALVPASFFGESIIILMLVFFMNEHKKVIRVSLSALMVTSVFMVISVVFVIMIFSAEIAGKLKYAGFELIQYINVMDFLQNLEIIAVLVWVLSVFIKLSVYLFLASYFTAQLFKIKDWKKTIWFVSAVSFSLSLIMIAMNSYGIKYVDVIWIPFVLPINIIGIPLLLWIVGGIRKKVIFKKK